MPTTTRTFRVFVSSTFEDLKEERDALQRDVFPKLRKLCEQHGARFQAIDLRWGVRDEAALDQRTMDICLREIERCKDTGVRPNFIVLLGDRYGWLPLPARVPATEFDPRPVTGDWYKLDENADSPEYDLQPRTGIFTNPDIWSVLEQVLHPRLEAAARKAGVTGPALSKYTDSATHQEVLAGLGEDEEDRQHVFGFFRHPTPETDARLDAVKALVLNHTEFAPLDLQALCDAVYDRLSRMIEEEARRFEDRPPLEVEIEAHDRFAADRARIFQGRRKELDAIADYLRDGERRPLVLRGASGSGKSAVMAKASLACPGRVLRRFIGATPSSAAGHSLLTGLCRQMAPGEETPVDFVKLARAFQERLAAVGPMVLFLDALDQLAARDPASDLTWIPRELPPQVKVVVSTTGDPAGLILELEPMKPSEGEAALDDWLRDTNRRLQPWQRAKVLDGFSRCGLPLYLKLAAEESRLWTSYAADAKCRVGAGVPGMIDTLSARLADIAGHGPVLVSRGLGYLATARHGLTEDEVLEVLTADDAVWADFDRHKHHEVERRQLPAVVWSRLSLDLEPYLTERAAPGGTVIAFYHRQLAEHVTTRFLVGDELRARHADLARYFAAKPAWLDEERKTGNPRRAVELMFQQRGAQRWVEAEQTLFDGQFLFAKCFAGMILDLDADYQALLQEAPATELPRRDALRLIHGALRLSMHVLVPAPQQFSSQIVGRLMACRYSPEVAAFVDEIAVVAPRPWFRPLHACFDPPGTALLRTLAGHSKGINGVAVTPDGKRAVSASRDKTLKLWDLETGSTLCTLEGHTWVVACAAVTPDGMRVVSSGNGTLKIWNLKTGSVLRTLEDPEGAIAVAVMPDGKRAVSASGNMLKVWDLETGRPLHTIEGPSDVLRSFVGMAVTPDGKRAVTASVSTQYRTPADKTLTVWDLATGRALRTLEGHTGEVIAVAVTPDGKRALSGSWDKTLKVWDIETGRELRTLEGHTDGVRCMAVTPDGKRAVSGSQDRTLRVWDLETGRTLQTLESHSFDVNAVAVTPDGKRAVSASADNTLKVWELETRSAPLHMQAHSHWVTAVAVTPDGKRALSASRDKTIKVWDIATGCALSTLEGHLDSIECVAAGPDGKRAASTSDNQLRVWDLETGRTVLTLEDRSWVKGLAVARDRLRAVFQDPKRGGSLIIWDVEAGRELATLAVRSNQSSKVDYVAMTADGQRAISSSWDNTLTVWDLGTGQSLYTLEGHWAPVNRVAVTPDGRRAVSVSWDKTLIMWDLETGRARRMLERHAGYVHGVTVRRDGRRAVSASQTDNSLRLWDLDGGLAIARLLCDETFCCCAFVDEKRIVAGDTGGRVYFLALEEDAGIPQSCARRGAGDQGGMAASQANQTETESHAAPGGNGERPSALAQTEPSCTPERKIPTARRSVTFDIPAAHPAADPENAARLNLEYIEARKAWEQLPWWKRFRAKQPTPPTGI